MKKNKNFEIYQRNSILINRSQKYRDGYTNGWLDALQEIKKRKKRDLN